MGGRRSGTRTERGSITSSKGNSPINLSHGGFNTKKIGTSLGRTTAIRNKKGESLAIHLWKHIGWMLVLPQAPGEPSRTIPKMRWSLRFPSFFGTGWLNLKPPWNLERQNNHWESSSLFVDVKHDWNCQPNDGPDTWRASPAHDWLKLSCCLGKSPFHWIQRSYKTTPDSKNLDQFRIFLEGI